MTGPASAVGGTSGAYAALVTNLSSVSTGTTARSVAVRISASSGATVTAATLNGWTCSVAAGVAVCSGGTLANGASATISVTVRYPNAAASISVTATADPSNVIAERDESNNVGSLATAVRAPSLRDLTVSMTGPGPVRGLYANGAWTMTITNGGTAAASLVNVSWLTNWGGDVTANAVFGAYGVSTVTATVDYGDQVVESNESNNSATVVSTMMP